MAVAVSRRKHEVKTGLRMNLLFFSMSLVILIVMGISMWKDTHPEWLGYQQQFNVLERQELLAKREELLKQIHSPSYEQDYDAARKSYQDAKAKFDDASNALETIEADIEELDIRTTGGNSEEGAAGDATSGKAAPAATATKAGKGELDELDKEFGSSGPAKTGTKPAQAENGAAKLPAKASSKELDDLDKEFAGGSPAKGTPKAPDKAAQATKQGPKAGSDEMAELDKEFADKTPKTSSNPAPAKGAAKPQSAELDELDKEFKGVGTKNDASQKGTVSQSAPAASQAAKYEEADLKVDIEGAKARLEDAQRDMLTAQRVYNREMIGLPASETLRRQVSESHLKEAKGMLEVAQTGDDLESAKAKVKTAAQVARWADDAKTLADLTAKNGLSSAPPDEVKSLQQSAVNLEGHVEDLKRNLRLVEGRLGRNQTGGTGVDQIFVDRLGAIDRCTTCHRSAEEAGFETAAEPFRTHSAEMLKFHPTERFGCVSCHGGWGNALTKFEAHGGVIGKGTPLLEGDQVQSSCGKCHGDTRQLSGESTYLAGSKLFKNSGCLGCHKVDYSRPNVIGGSVRIVQKEMPKAGPDLDRVGEKVQPGWLIGWLQNPQSHSIDARMPNLGLTKDQSISITTFLLTQKDSGLFHASSTPTTTDPNRLALGHKLTVNLGCMGCHAIRGEGATFGPELTNIGNKVDAQWLYGWIQNPKQYFPNSRMPNFRLSKDQCVLIGDYLLSLVDNKPKTTTAGLNLSDSDAKARGSQLISERGCAGCHDMKGFEKISAPELTHVGDKTADVLEFGNAKGVKKTLNSYIIAKITDPRGFDTDKFHGKMPKFGIVTDDAKSIATYLMSLTSKELPSEYTKDLQEQRTPLLAGRKVFEQHDCIACHRLTGQGGKIGPDLTREGEMVRPAWLFEFLKRPTRIRWWQDSRMPNYGLTDTEATALTEFFMALSNQPAPYEYTPPDQKVYPLAQSGLKYFTDLKCQSCHPLAGKQGVAGGDTKKLGPDLGMVPVRLKKDWLLRFLRDPQAFSPGTQMPTFGKSDDQYSAIIDFLMKQSTPP